jgi:hypothetical protein
MICGACRAGGYYNSAANACADNTIKQCTVFTVVWCHEQCFDPGTCACQHRTGKVTPR